MTPALPNLAVVRRALVTRAGERVEIVSLPSGPGRVRSHVFTLPVEIDQAVQFVATASADNPGCTVSMSIGTVTADVAGKVNDPTSGWYRISATKAEEAGLTMLSGYRWAAADLDDDKTDPIGIERLRQRLAAFPDPTMLVSSGTGIHAWWRLSKTLAVDAGAVLMRAIAAAVDGDDGAANPTRVLRIPGVWNDKPKAQRHAQLLASRDDAIGHDASRLLTIAKEIAPAPPSPAPSRPTRSTPSYVGDAIRETVRAEWDLAAELDRVCGPSHNKAWHCFAHDDGTPSLRLRQGSDDYAVCFGSTHPDNVGRQHDGYMVIDVFDLLAWEEATTSANLLSRLTREARARGIRGGSSPGMPGLATLISSATERA